MNNPLLSIITINYNNAKGLRKTMQSVMDLEFHDYEYIIIDGGSADESVDVIKEFMNIPKFASKVSFWSSEKDGGIYNAMNKGLTHVNGALVSMMNSGDAFVKDALNNLADIESNNKGAILYGAAKTVRDNEFVNVLGFNYKRLTESGLNHQSVLIPYALHKKYGFYDESYKICADYDFLLKCFTNEEKFCFIDKIICEFDLDGASKSSQRLTEKKMIQEKYLGQTKKRNLLKFIGKMILPYGIVMLFRNKTM